MSAPRTGINEIQEIPPYRPRGLPQGAIIVVDPTGTFTPPGQAAAAPEPVDIQQYLTAVTTSSLDSEDRTCGICTEAYNEQTENQEESQHTPVKLPCGHVFGSECITSWLSPETGRSNTCPLCRHELFPARQQPTTSNDGQGQWMRVNTADIPANVLAALQRQMPGMPDALQVIGGYTESVGRTIQRQRSDSS